jgi:hypothetical protein
VSRTKRKTKSKGPSSWETLSAKLGRAAHALVWLLLVAGLVAAWIVGVPQLESRAIAQPAPPQVAVTLVDAPAWLKGEDLAAIERAVQNALGENVLSRDDLVAAKASLEATGWFTSVGQVHRTSVDRVEVRGEFVTPFALIRNSSGDHLIDTRGVVLPKTAPAGAMPQFMVIINPAEPTRPAPGQVWTGADVEAGLTLIRRLQEKPWRQQVAAIDLGQFSSAGGLYLVSDRGCRIKWGAPPGREGAREVGAAQKLKYLQFHFDRSGHIDRGYASLDLSGDYVPTW